MVKLADRTAAFRAAFASLTLTLLFGVPSSVAASPDDSIADWLKARVERFPTFAAAQPAQNEAIEALKTKTASLIAAAPPLEQTELSRLPVIWRTGSAAVVILDDPVAPRMMVVPAGEFTMGSPAGEPGHSTTEGPLRRVRIGYPFAVSLFPVVYGEFEEFAAATHRSPRTKCVTFEQGVFAARRDRDWNNPGFVATPRGAAGCVSFADATAYTVWLTKKTGHFYRLLSEAEYEYVGRAGTTTAYWWGTEAAEGCPFANGYDLDATRYIGAPTPVACHDGHAAIAGVGLLKPNAFGLFDMVGNVTSWTLDCWNASYSGSPTDGSAVIRGNCISHVLRGSSWASADMRAAHREKGRAGAAVSYSGFRIARML